MASENIKYTFIPEYSAQVFADSSWFWPPQKFTLKCSIRAVDSTGKTVWSSKYQAVGTSTREDYSKTLTIAAKRAATIVFQKMQKDLKAFAF